MQLETVKIVAAKSDGNPLGYIVINKSDLADGMELYVDPADAAAAKAKADADAKAAADAAAADAAKNTGKSNNR